MPKIDKKERILKAAVDLFGKAHAARKVSVEEIAAAAHVSPTTIYNYFGTRDTLVLETARDLIREIMKMTAAVLRSDLSFPEKMRVITAGKMGLTAQYSSEVLGKLLKESLALTRAGREIYDAEVKKLWKEFIDSGKRGGYIDPSLNDSELLTYFDILRAGIAAMPETMEGMRDDPARYERLTNIICFGFLKKGVKLFPAEEKVNQ
jgi:AcrR family transcriptional regulator